MNKVKIIGLIITISSILASCQMPLHSEYHTMDTDGWHKDSAVTFDFGIDDTDMHYDMIVHMRHTERFPYQNMWLFTELHTPNDSIVMRDTIEFYLADERGVWLGNGGMGRKDMPVLYMENILLPDTGLYHLTIRQGMREERLREVTEVGLEILRHKQ